MSTDSNPDVVAVLPPLLRLELGRSAIILGPVDAGALGDELRAMKSPAAARLAVQIDVAVTTLLAAPLYAGTRSVRVAKDERGALREAALLLQREPSDPFAKLGSELSTLISARSRSPHHGFEEGGCVDGYHARNREAKVDCVNSR